MSVEENPKNSEKTLSVMIPMDEDESMHEKVEIPWREGMTVKEGFREAWKLKRGRSPSPDVIERVVFCAPVDNLVDALEIAKDREEDSMLLFGVDTSDGQFKIVEEIKLKIERSQYDSGPQDPRKKKQKEKE